VPIIAKKDLEKKTVPRGHTDVLYKEDLILVGWKDNKGVYMASNKFGADTSSNCRRFCRTERKNVMVPIPAMVQHYNSGMGGVDLMDNMVACYRIPFRIKKWWFPIYSWSLSVAAVNAWRLRMRQTGNKEPYLKFLRELCIDMLTQHGTQPTKKRSLSGDAQEKRFDNLGHWIVSTEEDAAGKAKRRNCKMCFLNGKPDLKSVFMCEKCEVPLHTHCFKGRVLCIYISVLPGQYFLQIQSGGWRGAVNKFSMLLWIGIGLF